MNVRGCPHALSFVPLPFLRLPAPSRLAHLSDAGLVVVVVVVVPGVHDWKYLRYGDGATTVPQMRGSLTVDRPFAFSPSQHAPDIWGLLASYSTIREGGAGGVSSDATQRMRGWPPHITTYVVFIHGSPLLAWQEHASARSRASKHGGCG